MNFTDFTAGYKYSRRQQPQVLLWDIQVVLLLLVHISSINSPLFLSFSCPCLWQPVSTLQTIHCVVVRRAASDWTEVTRGGPRRQRTELPRLLRLDHHKYFSYEVTGYRYRGYSASTISNTSLLRWQDTDTEVIMPQPSQNLLFLGDRIQNLYYRYRQYRDYSTSDWIWKCMGQKIMVTNFLCFPVYNHRFHPSVSNGNFVTWHADTQSRVWIDGWIVILIPTGPGDEQGPKWPRRPHKNIETLADKKMICQTNIL